MRFLPTELDLLDLLEDSCVSTCSKLNSTVKTDAGDRLYQLSQYNPSNSLFLRAAYSYDATGRVTQIQNSSGPTFTLGYQYDARSQVTIHTLSRSGPSSTSTYSYDAIGHLETSQRNGSTTRFIYDALGNRSKMNTSSGTSSYSYDANSGRLLTAAVTPSGNYTFSYDDNGNLTAVGVGAGSGSIGGSAPPASSPVVRAVTMS